MGAAERTLGCCIDTTVEASMFCWWWCQLARPANNPLHRTGLSVGRAVSIPSAMSVRIGCCGAVAASR
jgi:hypothetical protein